MSLFLRLQNLHPDAKPNDIRNLFSGLTISEGNIRIIGGPDNEAFIWFKNKSDLLGSMVFDQECILGQKVTLVIAKSKDDAPNAKHLSDQNKEQDQNTVSSKQSVHSDVQEENVTSSIPSATVDAGLENEPKPGQIKQEKKTSSELPDKDKQDGEDVGLSDQDMKQRQKKHGYELEQSNRDGLDSELSDKPDQEFKRRKLCDKNTDQTKGTDKDLKRKAEETTEQSEDCAHESKGGKEGDDIKRKREDYTLEHSSSPDKETGSELETEVHMEQELSDPSQFDPKYIKNHEYIRVLLKHNTAPQHATCCFWKSIMDTDAYCSGVIVMEEDMGPKIVCLAFETLDDGKIGKEKLLKIKVPTPTGSNAIKGVVAYTGHAMLFNLAKNASDNWALRESTKDGEDQHITAQMRGVLCNVHLNPEHYEDEEEPLCTNPDVEQELDGTEPVNPNNDFPQTDVCELETSVTEASTQPEDLSDPENMSQFDPKYIKSHLYLKVPLRHNTGPEFTTCQFWQSIMPDNVQCSGVIMIQDDTGSKIMCLAFETSEDRKFGKKLLLGKNIQTSTGNKAIKGVVAYTGQAMLFNLAKNATDNWKLLELTNDGEDQHISDLMRRVLCNVHSNPDLYEEDRLSPVFPNVQQNQQLTNASKQFPDPPQIGPYSRETLMAEMPSRPELSDPRNMSQFDPVYIKSHMYLQVPLRHNTPPEFTTCHFWKSIIPFHVKCTGVIVVKEDAGSKIVCLAFETLDDQKFGKKHLLAKTVPTTTGHNAIKDVIPYTGQDMLFNLAKNAFDDWTLREFVIDNEDQYITDIMRRVLCNVQHNPELYEGDSCPVFPEVHEQLHEDECRGPVSPNIQQSPQLTEAVKLFPGSPKIGPYTPGTARTPNVVRPRPGLSVPKPCKMSQFDPVYIKSHVYLKVHLRHNTPPEFTTCHFWKYFMPVHGECSGVIVVKQDSGSKVVCLAFETLDEQKFGRKNLLTKTVPTTSGHNAIKDVVPYTGQAMLFNLAKNASDNWTLREFIKDTEDQYITEDMRNVLCHVQLNPELYEGSRCPVFPDVRKQFHDEEESLYQASDFQQDPHLTETIKQNSETFMTAPGGPESSETEVPSPPELSDPNDMSQFDPIYIKNHVYLKVSLRHNTVPEFTTSHFWQSTMPGDVQCSGLIVIEDDSGSKIICLAFETVDDRKYGKEKLLTKKIPTLTGNNAIKGVVAYTGQAMLFNLATNAFDNWKLLELTKDGDEQPITDSMRGVLCNVQLNPEQYDEEAMNMHPYGQQNPHEEESLCSAFPDAQQNQQGEECLYPAFHDAQLPEEVKSNPESPQSEPGEQEILDEPKYPVTELSNDPNDMAQYDVSDPNDISQFDPMYIKSHLYLKMSLRPNIPLEFTTCHFWQSTMPDHVKCTGVIVIEEDIGSKIVCFAFETFDDRKLGKMQLLEKIIPTTTGINAIKGVVAYTGQAMLFNIATNASDNWTLCESTFDGEDQYITDQMRRVLCHVQLHPELYGEESLSPAFPDVQRDPQLMEAIKPNPKLCQTEPCEPEASLTEVPSQTELSDPMSQFDPMYIKNHVYLKVPLRRNTPPEYTTCYFWKSTMPYHIQCTGVIVIEEECGSKIACLALETLDDQKLGKKKLLGKVIKTQTGNNAIKAVVAYTGQAMLFNLAKNASDNWALWELSEDGEDQYITDQMRRVLCHVQLNPEVYEEESKCSSFPPVQQNPLRPSDGGWEMHTSDKSNWMGQERQSYGDGFHTKSREDFNMYNSQGQWSRPYANLSSQDYQNFDLALHATKDALTGPENSMRMSQQNSYEYARRQQNLSSSSQFNREDQASSRTGQRPMEGQALSRASQWQDEDQTLGRMSQWREADQALSRGQWQMEDQTPSRASQWQDNQVTGRMGQWQADQATYRMNQWQEDQASSKRSQWQDDQAPTRTHQWQDDQSACRTSQWQDDQSACRTSQWQEDQSASRTSQWQEDQDPRRMSQWQEDQAPSGMSQWQEDQTTSRPSWWQKDGQAPSGASWWQRDDQIHGRTSQWQEQDQAPNRPNWWKNVDGRPNPAHSNGQSQKEQSPSSMSKSQGAQHSYAAMQSDSVNESHRLDDTFDKAVSSGIEYLRLIDLHPHITACQLLKSFKDTGLMTAGMTLVRDENGNAQFAFLGVLGSLNEYLPSLGLTQGTYMVASPTRRNQELAHLPLSYHILESTDTGTDCLVTPDERAGRGGQRAQHKSMESGRIEQISGAGGSNADYSKPSSRSTSVDASGEKDGNGDRPVGDQSSSTKDSTSDKSKKDTDSDRCKTDNSDNKAEKTVGVNNPQSYVY